jgi:hypothetical protein
MPLATMPIPELPTNWERVIRGAVSKRSVLFTSLFLSWYLLPNGFGWLVAKIFISAVLVLGIICSLDSARKRKG